MKKTEQINYHVVVTPDFGNFPWVYHDNRYKDACEAIAIAIRRHVDGISRTAVQWETKSTCSYCGCPWTEESTEYNGGCCHKDEANKRPLLYELGVAIGWIYSWQAYNRFETREGRCSVTRSQYVELVAEYRKNMNPALKHD